jgi:hypothetical protein
MFSAEEYPDGSIPGGRRGDQSSWTDLQTIGAWEPFPQGGGGMVMESRGMFFACGLDS